MNSRMTMEQNVEELLTEEENSSEEANSIEWKNVNPPKIEPELEHKLKKIHSSAKTNPGIVCLGRIPHGFFEPQIHAYFSQFGKIIRLRLSRNKKVSTIWEGIFILWDIY